MVSKAFSNLLKHIDKLPHTKKEQVYHWVKRYVEPSSAVGCRLINEMRETRFKEGYICPHCDLNTLLGSENTMVANATAVSVVVRPLLIPQTPFYISLEKVTNGLHLLIICSKVTPCVNLPKSLVLLGLRFFIGDTNC